MAKKKESEEKIFLDELEIIVKNNLCVSIRNDSQKKFMLGVVYAKGKSKDFFADSIGKIIEQIEKDKDVKR